MPVWMILPKLGINMTEGLIVEWLVKEGDSVEKGQPLVEIETDKAVQQVEAPASGILARITARPGETVPCSQVIAAITQPGEGIPGEIPIRIGEDDAPDASAETMAGVGKEADSGRSQTLKRQERLQISPVARKLAAELGIELHTIKAAAPDGRIGRDDVLRTAEEIKVKAAHELAPPVNVRKAGQVIPMAGVRGVIAERMSQSARETAPVLLVTDANAGQLAAWREHLRRDYPQQLGDLGYNELLVLVVSRALRAFPAINASLRQDGVHLLEEINVGVAVDSERGLLVPVIRNADQKDIFQIHTEFVSLVEAARYGRSSPDDLTGGTFTISNLGMYEIDAFAPIINLPEAAILGVGRIAQKPVAAGEQVVVQKRMTLSLVFDHRLVDGAPAARFLQQVKHLIEAPYLLIV